MVALFKVVILASSILEVSLNSISFSITSLIFSIFTVYLISYFTKIDFNPLLEIVVRSVGIVIAYLVMIYFLGISQKLKDILNLKFKF